jgi:pimeloyl-ACP methyl ester carboxylesterase
MHTTHRIRARFVRTILVAAVAVCATATVPTALSIPPAPPPTTTNALDRPTPRLRGAVVQWTIHYQANGDRRRIAYVVLPRWYGPHRNPRLPLIISPHGVGSGPFNGSVRRWGDLASVDRFAIVFPEGQGRELAHHSWGYRGQVDDLARMPAIVAHSLPWIRIDRRRIYAVGGSMGGQETLLLAARYPRLLAGAIAFDAPTDMALRYEQFGALDDGETLRELMQYEVGAVPDADPTAYEERSPLASARAIACSGVPLQIWWSTGDHMVGEGQRHSGRLYREIRQLNPRARVQEIVGAWEHGESMRWNRRLPEALRFIGLQPDVPTTNDVRRGVAG